MKKNVYKVGFLVLAIKYLYSIINSLIFRYIEGSMELYDIQRVVKINNYIVISLNIVFILILVIISIMELNDTSDRRVKRMSVINACLPIVLFIIGVGISQHLGRVGSGVLEIPLANSTMGGYFFLVSIVSSAISFVVHIAILIMMIMSYRSRESL